MVSLFIFVQLLASSGVTRESSVPPGVLACSEDPCRAICSALMRMGATCATIDESEGGDDGSQCTCSECCVASPPPPPPRSPPPPIPACQLEPCATMCRRLRRLAANRTRAVGGVCADVAQHGAECGCSDCCVEATSEPATHLLRPRWNLSAAAVDGVNDGGDPHHRGAVRGRHGGDDYRHKGDEKVEDEEKNWRNILRQMHDDPISVVILVLMPFLSRVLGDVCVDVTLRIGNALCCGCCDRAGLTRTSCCTSNAPGVSVAAAMTREFNWAEAVERTGMAPWTAVLVAVCKLLLWHLAQPAAYFVIVLALWEQLGHRLRVLCWWLKWREGSYGLLALMAALSSPACLLASPWSRPSSNWDSNTALDAAVYMFWPEAFLANVLGAAYFRGEGKGEPKPGPVLLGGTAFWVVSLPLDVVGVIAFVNALKTGAPAALSVALGVMSLPILAPCVFVCMAACFAVVAGLVWGFKEWFL